MYENYFQTILELDNSIVPFIKIRFLNATHEDLVPCFVIFPKVSACSVGHRSWGEDRVGSDRDDRAKPRLPHPPVQGQVQHVNSKTLHWTTRVHPEWAVQWNLRRGARKAGSKPPDDNPSDSSSSATSAMTSMAVSLGNTLSTRSEGFLSGRPTGVQLGAEIDDAVSRYVAPRA